MTHHNDQRSDREQIHDLKLRYAYAIDERDWDALRDVFTDDVVLDYGARIGDYEGREGVDEFIEYVSATLDGSAHNMENLLIEVDGDVATGKAYVNSREAFADGPMAITQGKYADTYRRTEDGWKIDSLKMRIFFQVQLTEDGIQQVRMPDDGPPF